MKNLRGALVLDFCVQAILVGIFVSVAVIAAFLPGIDPGGFLFGNYLVLGGWQLLFAILLRLAFRYEGLDSYLKFNAFFFSAGLLMFGLTAMGELLSFEPFFMFLVLFIFWISLVPPILAIARFVGAYHTFTKETDIPAEDVRHSSHYC